MPLQNRVNPFGQIIASLYRGNWMGNRGILHKNKKIISNHKTKCWIVCSLTFNGRRREIMKEGSYTELFFLDEATAYAAGHRPCGECRREAFKTFKEIWINANKDNCILTDTTIKTIDTFLHQERMDNTGNKITFKEQLKNLPDGVFVKIDDLENCYLYLQDKLLKWSVSGYSEYLQLPLETSVNVITPISIVRTYQFGLIPEIHDSAIIVIKTLY